MLGFLLGIIFSLIVIFIFVTLFLYGAKQEFPSSYRAFKKAFEDLMDDVERY